MTGAGLIGVDAQPKVEVNYADMFKRAAYMAGMFNTAAEIASEDMPMLTKKFRLNTLDGQGFKLHEFSWLPVSQYRGLSLAVGTPETGFYQVPVIKIMGGKGEEGIDVMVSGTIDGKGKATSYPEAKKLTEQSKEFYDVGMDDANRVYAVALVPKSELIGDQVLVGGTGTLGCPIFNMILNGYALDRKIVGSAPGYMYLGTAFAPVMFPGENGEEMYLKLGDILGKKEMKALESRGVTPGMTFVAGTFKQAFKMPDIVLRSMSFNDEMLGAPATMGGGAMRGGDLKGPGRVGLEVGEESNVKYGKIEGNITSIDGVLAIHFICVNEGDSVDTIRQEVMKLV